VLESNYISHKIKLRPTEDQIVLLKKTTGSARFAYNWGLARVKEHYERGEKWSMFSLDKEFNSLKKEHFPWIYEVSSKAVQVGLQKVSIAYTNFFKKRAKYPRFKSKKKSKESFCIPGANVKHNKKSLTLSKFDKPIKMTQELRFTDELCFVTVSRDSCGDWYASFTVEPSKDFKYAHKCKIEKSVGVDLGIKTLAVTSHGEEFINHKFHKKFEKKLKRLQRSLSRKKLGSNRREKARLSLARQHRKVRNAREDNLHKVTTKLVESYRTIAIEDLNVKGMTKNHCLAKSLSDASFGAFRSMLEYKSKLSGSEVRIAPRFYPSSKTCSNCGHVLRKLSLSQRSWECPQCHTTHDRDRNAAVNIERVCRPRSEGDVKRSVRKRKTRGDIKSSQELIPVKRESCLSKIK
jgi:putative transposase